MKALFQLIRWQNLLMTALVVWLMEKMVAAPLMDKALFGEQLPGWVFYLLMLALVFVAAGGYAINDYFDVKIDSINRPDRLIVTRELSKQQAMLVHQLMTGTGVALGLITAVWLRSWSVGLVFVLVPGLLWFYSSAYKRQFVVGNLIVSLCAGMVPLLVAMANTAVLNKRYGSDVMQYSGLPHDLYVWIGGFAFFAFLTTLVREILKDLQDQTGDRELECHTLPVLLGETWTKVILTVLIGLLAGSACYAVLRLMPFGHTWSSMPVRYLTFGLLVPLVCELYLLWSARIPSDYRFAQGLMKFIMLLGVLFSIVIKVQL